MKVKMYVMANDAIWMEMERDISFTPCPGMDLVGISGEQPLRISGAGYDFAGDFFKVRLAWLSDSPLNSSQLIDIGWTAAKK